MKIISITKPIEWDRFVLKCPEAVLGHLFAWRSVIKAAYGHESLYLAAVDSDNANCIRAILPLFRMKQPFCRSRWISIPFFDQAGILSVDRQAGKWLLMKAGSVLKHQNNSSLSLRQNDRAGFLDMVLEGRHPEAYTEKVGMKIPLAANRQKMMGRFRSKLRSQIKKGVKNGLTWKIGKVRLLDDFYLVFSRNMRDLGSPVHSKSFFREIFKHFFANAFICIVYYHDQPCAASFMFRFKNSLANPWASSIKDFRHLNTNMVLYWQMIGFACNLGLEFFDMGRSSAGAATHKFKQQWAPAETPLVWYTWQFNDVEKRREETLSIDPWKKLPVWSANLAGPWLRKYISL